MVKHDTPVSPPHSSPARRPIMNLPLRTSTSKPPQPKARTPSNTFVTYKECLKSDNAARRRARSLVKETDQYILEMDHRKREEMLEAAAQEVDAKRIKQGQHVSCLFEEKYVEEVPLRPEEAAEIWEATKRDIAAKVSGLRGKPKPKVMMMPKTIVLSDEKALVEESIVDLADEINSNPEMVTSKGISVVMLEDD